MFCDNCGNEISDNTIICPFCGILTENAKAQQSFNSGVQGQQAAFPQDDLSSFGGPGPYHQGYGPMPNPAPRATGYMPPPPQSPGYASASYASMYPQQPVTIINHTSNDGAVIAEILLSLVGIFGVGWLIGGETTIGVILLICSFVIYWPIMILGTLFTFGIGLVCLGPLAIGAIILNALLCSRVLKRRASQFIVVQPSPQPQMRVPPMQRP